MHTCSSTPTRTFSDLPATFKPCPSSPASPFRSRCRGWGGISGVRGAEKGSERLRGGAHCPVTAVRASLPVSPLSCDCLPCILFLMALHAERGASQLQNPCSGLACPAAGRRLVRRLPTLLPLRTQSLQCQTTDSNPPSLLLAILSLQISEAAASARDRAAETFEAAKQKAGEVRRSSLAGRSCWAEGSLPPAAAAACCSRAHL